MSDNDEIKDSWRVVVVGAGFWRVSAATGLAWPQFQVTPIYQHNFHLLEPLLYQVASGARQRGTCFITGIIRSRKEDTANPSKRAARPPMRGRLLWRGCR